MGANSKIEWTDHTFSPWRGCTKVSPACDHCYAEAYGKRFGVAWGPGAKRVRASESYWRQPLAWDRKAAKAGKPIRVFCASLSDVFDAEVPDQWRDGLFHLIDRTPHLIWMLLTKRPKVALDYLGKSVPRPNVWIGVTVENQAMADLRIPLLLETPAAKRFISAEPLLGPLEIGPVVRRFREMRPSLHGQQLLDWIITGGESGPHARPSHPNWFRSLRDQCAAAGVLFFFKQWGEWCPEIVACSRDAAKTAQRINLLGDARPARFGARRDGEVTIQRVGKKAAGRLLDGREWNEVPA